MPLPPPKIEALCVVVVVVSAVAWSMVTLLVLIILSTCFSRASCDCGAWCGPTWKDWSGTRFLGLHAISRPVSKRTNMQPGGHGQTATLGCKTCPLMPLSSAFLTRLTSCTLVYGLNRVYISSSLKVLSDEVLEELSERFRRDLLGLRFLRSFSSPCRFSFARLRLRSLSSCRSRLIFDFFDFFFSSRGSALTSRFTSRLTSRFTVFATSPSSSKSMQTTSRLIFLPSCLTMGRAETSTTSSFFRLGIAPASSPRCQGPIPRPRPT
mmetsp:Transcript_40740/g.117985  ORF Transcript_40740/g.117985 Transcript_40740/m.117985 type:complete len:266 (-) Transcript_40740:3-800(-)